MIELFKAQAFLLKMIATGTVVAVAVTSCMIRDTRIENRGADKVVSASREQGKINAKKADKAHDSARAPGAAERLRKDSCRDCN